MLADQQRREADVNGRERLGPVRMLEQERLPCLERPAFGEDYARLRDAALFEHVVHVARGRPGRADHRVVQMADDSVVHVDDRGVRHAFRVDARFENGIEAGIGPEPRVRIFRVHALRHVVPGAFVDQLRQQVCPGATLLQQDLRKRGQVPSPERNHGQADDQGDAGDLFGLETQRHSSTRGDFVPAGPPLRRRSRGPLRPAPASAKAPARLAEAPAARRRPLRRGTPVARLAVTYSGRPFMRLSLLCSVFRLIPSISAARVLLPPVCCSVTSINCSSA